MESSPSRPLAFSYIRFSHPEQAKGDSLRRQTTGAEEYCARHGLALDTTLSLQDLGVSAFRGAHRMGDKHALAQFLALARRGRIPAGSYLIIENLDRLSREDERPALRLWMDILDQKINIVQLHPETVFRHEKSDMLDIMRAVMELSRGHGESARKSERLGEAWDNKRAQIGSRKLTGKAPFWLELSGDRTRFVERPGAVRLVRRLFRLAREGQGSLALARTLNEEGTPSPYGRPWNNVSVLWVLRSRAVLGEYTPHRGRPGSRQAAGPPVPDYYPRIVGEEEFWAVQSAITLRKKQRGPRGRGVRNLFTELVKDARDGTPMHVTEKRKGDFRMISSGAMRGAAGTKYVSFPFDVFERAVLSLLAEIDPREVLGREEGPDEAMVLSGELARVESSIAMIEADMNEHGESPALFRRIRAKEEEKRALAARLADAWQRAASPLSGAWGEAKALLLALDAAPDPEDARLRLRSALRRVIAEVWVLVVPRGRDRIAAVQVWFADGKRRDYLILHRPGGWRARSFADAAAPGDLDLRDRDHARRLEAVLAAIDLKDDAPR